MKFLILTVIVTLVKANDLVYIRNEFGQLITSSTLKWSKGIVEDPIVLLDGILCRTQDGGVFQIGHVSQQSTCLGNPNYQTLPATSTYTKWLPWTRPSLPPHHSISFTPHKPYYFIAKSHNSLGYLDPRNLGSIITDTSELSGDVLVEIEPIKYELKNIVFSRGLKFEREEIVLNKYRLKFEENMEDEDFEMQYNTKEEEIDGVLSWGEADGEEDWGGVAGMVKGVETRIELRDGGEWGEDNGLEVEWGIIKKWDAAVHTLRISRKLKLNTAVNATLIGIKYSGILNFVCNLTTYYPDGHATNRILSGYRSTTRIVKKNLIYSPMYYISNGSIVPEPTTTTTSTSTTTTTTEKSTSTTTTGTTTRKAKETTRQTEATTERERDKYEQAKYSNGNRLSYNIFVFILALIRIF